MTVKHKYRSSSAFTIVELLVVIVVIGILAAITIVSYSGITNKANIASLSSDLTNASQQLKLFQIDNSNYPATISTDCATNPDSDTNKCLKVSNGATYEYYVVNTANNQNFCITATKGSYSYSINNNGSTIPTAYCPVLYLDASNSLSYPGAGNNKWYDLSGNNNNGTLNGGVSYSTANGGVMGFDGTSGIIGLGTNIQMGTSDFTVSVWIKINSTQATGATYHAILNNKAASAASAGFGLVWNNSTNKFLWSTADGTNATEIWSTNTWNTAVLDKWAQVVMVRQSGSTNNGCFYINGIYESLASSATIRNVNSSNQLNIGNTGVPYGAYYLTGLINDMRIYNKALSSDDVLQNFNATKGRYGL